MLFARYLLALPLSLTLLNLAQAQDKQGTRQVFALTWELVPPTPAKGKSKDKMVPKKDNALEVGKNGINLDSRLDEKDGAYKDNKIHAKIFLVRLLKGKTYQFDMISSDFDSYLYLEDAGKNLLAEDDDSGGGDTGLDSRFRFTAKEDGSYRVIATSYSGDELGNFKLLIVEK